MSEQVAFLAAIIAAPEDDLPRLVYADWLDENGDPDRAEFIRLQIERLRTKEEKQYPRPMKDRITQLRGVNESKWRAELPSLPGVTWGRYWRGFISEAKFDSPAALLEHAGEVFATTPVQMVQVSGLGPDSAEEVCRLPQLTGLYGLRLDEVSTEPAMWQMLTDQEWFGQIYHLIVYPARPMGGWVVARPQQNEVIPLVLAAAARPQSRMRIAHLEMGDASLTNIAIPPRLTLTGLPEWEPL